jgi:hypothetical protein
MTFKHLYRFNLQDNNRLKMRQYPCSVAKIKETNKVLLKNFLPTIIAGLIFGVIAILIKKNMNEL